MLRTARAAEGGVVSHVLNRGNDGRAIFRKPADYAAFVQLLLEGKTRAKLELFAYCLMPNHWHLVLRPCGDDDLARYLSWVSNTHVKRYRAHYRGSSGHLYQGRYKSFPVQADEHLLTVMRYVEANAVRPTLAKRVQDWPWSSAAVAPAVAAALLSPWPVDRPANWTALPEPAAGRGANGAGSHEHRAGPAVGRAGVDQAGGGADGAGVHAAPARTPAHMGGREAFTRLKGGCHLFEIRARSNRTRHDWTNHQDTAALGHGQRLDRGRAGGPDRCAASPRLRLDA